MKPVLLFATCTFNLAETTRMIEIARAAERSFTPHFYGYGGEYAYLIDEAGYPLDLLQPAVTPEKVAYLMRVDRLEEYGHPFTIAELDQRVAAELALFRQLQPVAVVMGSVLSAPISTRAAGVPLVNVIPFPLSRAYLQAGLPALPNLLSLPWLPRPVGRLLNRLASAAILHVPLLTRNFNVVARSHGLPRFPSLMAVWEGDINLITDVPLLTGVPTLPPNWHYVGPIFAHLDRPVPEEVLALAREKRRPLLYFAMGSSGNRQVVVDVLRSLGDLDVDVIAPVRPLLGDMAVTPPPNVLVTNWLPALEVNRLADLAVLHGGQGTVQTACRAGLPFVGIGMQPEQEINVQWVADWGSARRIPRSAVTPARVRSAVESLLADPRARERAAALAAEFEKWPGAANVAAFLETRFGDNAPPDAFQPVVRQAPAAVNPLPWLAAAGAALLGLLALRRLRRRRQE